VNTFSVTIPEKGIEIFKDKMLNWLKQFNIFCLLDSNDFGAPSSSVSWLAAAGAQRSITLTKSEDYKGLKDFYEEKPTYIFGHFNYDFVQQKI